MTSITKFHSHGSSITGAVLLSVIFILLPVRLCAADSGQTQSTDGVDTVETTQVIPMTQRSWDWLLERREQVSRGVTQLGRSLDDWLAGEGIGAQQNETMLSVRLNQQFGHYDHYNSKVKIGGRLDLPAVSERWKLIFESDTQDLNTLQENVLDQTNSSDSVGGFRYQEETESGWDLSHDVGIRSLAPADPFYRFRARYTLPVNDVWSASLDQRFWYYDTKGWGVDTEVSFIREIDVDRFIRIASEGVFRDDLNLTQFRQTAALYRTLGPDETLGYELGVLGVNRPSIRVDDYYAQVLYRRGIYEDWLFMELTPQVVVSRDEHWRPQPRILLNLEMLFFDF